MNASLKYGLLGTLVAFAQSACAGGAVQESLLRDRLGDNLATVQYADTVVVAELKVIAAVKAQEQALQNDDQIAGYPIDGTSVEADATLKNTIRDTLLSEPHYSSMPRRCLNERFIGIRFQCKSKKVEVALGVPCNQIVWAYPAPDAVGIWGAVLGEEPMQQLVSDIDATF